MNLRQKPIAHLTEREKSQFIWDSDSIVAESRYGTQEPPKTLTTGQRIKAYRLECGWSQNDLSKKTGLDKKQIQRHENEKQKPIPATLKLYADAFTKDRKRPILVNDLIS